MGRVCWAQTVGDTKQKGYLWEPVFATGPCGGVPMGRVCWAQIVGDTKQKGYLWEPVFARGPAAWYLWGGFPRPEVLEIQRKETKWRYPGGG